MRFIMYTKFTTSNVPRTYVLAYTSSPFAFGVASDYFQVKIHVFGEIITDEDSIRRGAAVLANGFAILLYKQR